MSCFAVPSIAQLSERTKINFAVGRKVTFSDGTVRTIVKLQETAGSLIVYVDGVPLDGTQVGYPKKIMVSEL
jgi:hypothetical protein